jgi:hypothetical protein
MSLNNIVLCFSFVFIVVLIYNYFRYVTILRNEAEYRDLVEYQTMLTSALLFKNPSILPTLSHVRYFPDQSGFFVVLNFDGNILSHGDYDGNMNEILPFNVPVTSIIEIAKNGGGYVKYNYKGYIYDSFVYNYPGSPFIVCSGLYNDPQHIQSRTHLWKRQDKSLLKTPSQAKSSKRHE